MKKSILAASVVGLLVLAGLAAAFVTGVGPAPGGPGAGPSNVTTFPTETPTGTTDGTTTPSGETTTDDGAGSGSTATTATTATPPFAFTIDRIESCGTTCRNVTATLYNRQDEAATGVTVYTRIFAGNSTAEDDRIWRGSEDVGRLAAGGSHTATREVTLSYTEGIAVQRADGWVTIQTTVQTDDRTITFTRHREVA